MKKINPVLLYIVEIVLFGLLVFLDLASKSLAVSRLKGQPSVPLIPGVLEFFYLENKGAAFSMLENAQWFFAIIACVALIAIVWFLVKVPKKNRYLPLCISLVFIGAGALGNLIDRISLNYVRDFIYFSLINFPVFNVADMYVTVCTALIMILVLFYYKDDDFAFLKK